MKTFTLLLSALVFIAASACGQDNGRLQIEGITLGMTMEQFGDDLLQRGWVQLSPGSWTFGERGQPGFRGLGFRYSTGPREPGTGRQVEQISLNPRLQPDPDAVEGIFEQFVDLYGEPDACEENRLRPGQFSHCTWTRQFEGVDETLHWQLGIGGRPGLRLAVGPGLEPEAAVSETTPVPQPTPEPAAAQGDFDVNALLKEMSEGPLGELTTCRVISQAIARGSTYTISGTPVGDVTVVEDGVMRYDMPEACQD